MPRHRQSDIARCLDRVSLPPTRAWPLVFAMLVFAQPAHGHGIAGNRYFPGTLTFDDPAVADELLFAPVSLVHPGNGTDVRDTSVGWSFMRLLTQDLAVGASGGWIEQGGCAVIVPTGVLTPAHRLFLQRIASGEPGALVASPKSRYFVNPRLAGVPVHVRPTPPPPALYSLTVIRPSGNTSSMKATWPAFPTMTAT